MKVISRKPVAVLPAAANYESSKMGFIDSLVFCKSDISIDPEDAALCFKTFQYRFKLSDVVNQLLNKLSEIFSRLIIPLSVICKPDTVIVALYIF